jgi:chromosome segregation ATPase
MTDPIAKIKAALAAGPTPGPWRHIAFSPRNQADRDFVKACTPEAIAALLAELEAEQAELRDLRNTVAAQAECINAYKPDMQDLQRQVLSMQNELEAAQADARRYRAVYDAARGLCMGVDWNKGTHAKAYRQKLERAVAAIDEAMKKIT